VYCVVVCCVAFGQVFGPRQGADDEGCTLLTSDALLNFTPSDVQEATVDMVASGRTFLLRIQTDDGKTGYGHSAFLGSQQFATLFSVKKQIFVVRGVYA
jgi:hypothetical protein